VLGLFGAGILSAAALAGCGGGGRVASTLPTTGGGSAGALPGVTRTLAERTVERTRSAASDTQTQPAATGTHTTPGVTVTQAATTAVTVTGSPQVTLSTATAATTAATDSGSTPGWVWIVVAAAGGLLIALLVWLLHRDSSRPSLAERQRLVAATVARWTEQGWAIESQTETSAVLRQDGERIVVTVAPDGQISSRPLGGPSAPEKLPSRSG
jgi:hypothetical protein